MTSTDQMDSPHNELELSGSGDSGERSSNKREKWTHKIDFLLACIGASVGLANVWRFPFLCYRHGGGAFLIPYFISVLVVAVPIFVLEVSLGQFMSEAGIGPWKICPLFTGIGYAWIAVNFLFNCYYIVILAWSFYYVFASFTVTLPWVHCDNDWNTLHCSTFDKQITENASLGNISATASPLTNSTSSYVAYDLQNHANRTGKGISLVDPVTEFWERRVLDLSRGVDDVNYIKWDLALCLLLAWVVVYFCIWKGVKTSSKVMYVTATSPYIFMFVLLIRGVTLDGAGEGIKYYIFPDLSRLQDYQVWVDAGSQTMFSYAIGQGVLPAVGSYNKFHHNMFRDCAIFAAVNSLTSILAGFVTFSVLGFMSQKQQIPISEVAESGPGLAFISYPEALAQLPLAPMWSCFFFLMIILLGIDSQFVNVEAFVSAIVDMYPNYLRRGYNREIFVSAVCAVCFSIGLCMVTDGGMYVFQLFDYYSSGRIILLVICLECIVVAYIYGSHRFFDNIQMMLGFQMHPFLMIFWKFLTPVSTIVIFILSVLGYSEVKYRRKILTYEFPEWIIGIGWIFALAPVSFIPVTMILKIIAINGTIFERVSRLLRPRLRRYQLRINEDMSKVDIIDDAQTIPEEPRSDENSHLVDMHSKVDNIHTEV